MSSSAEPKRPEFPIEGRTIEDWSNHYQRELSDWYRACHGRYADSMEWDAFVGLQFDCQRSRDEEMSKCLQIS